MSMTVNTYPGGVAQITIPTIQPSESMSVVGLVLLIVFGLVLVSVLALLIMYFMNRSKLKAGGAHALVFRKSTSTAPKDSDDPINVSAGGIYEAEGKNAPQNEESMRMEDVSVPRVVAQE